MNSETLPVRIKLMGKRLLHTVCHINAINPKNVDPLYTHMSMDSTAVAVYTMIGCDVEYTKLAALTRKANLR